MPNVGGKKFPYTKQGMKDAEEAKDKMGYKKGGDVKKKMPKEAKKKAPVSRVPGKTKTARGKSLEELGMTPSKPSKNPAKATMNNTSAPKPPTPPQAAMAPMGGAPKPPMGGAPKPPMGAPAGGMGGMGKPPMMNKGGKVKKGGSCGGYKKGGKVRGCGIAKQGVRACKMR